MPVIWRVAWSGSGGIFDVDALKRRKVDLDDRVAAPDLWDDPEMAQKVLKEQSDVKAAIASVLDPFVQLEEVELLLEMGEEEDDESVFDDAIATLDKVLRSTEKLELRRMLGQPGDKNNAILHINAGAGGTESLDWAGMLLRMYLRFCEAKGWKCSMLHQEEGDEAGVKSVTIQVAGDYAFGMLKAETGVHRLVRISPFDAAARRHTSFASVAASPEVDDSIEIEVSDADIRIDTYRAGGAGGQHVNKTDSAVRITHLPTGLVVQCQNERSQMKNRSTAMKILKSRLYQVELDKRRAVAEAQHGAKSEISFGSQIRSYVLQPYRMVKDHRTNHETGNTDDVLDGNLDPFIEAFLMADD